MCAAWLTLSSAFGSPDFRNRAREIIWEGEGGSAVTYPGECLHTGVLSGYVLSVCAFWPQYYDSLRRTGCIRASHTRKLNLKTSRAKAPPRDTPVSIPNVDTKSPKNIMGSSHSAEKEMLETWARDSRVWRVRTAGYDRGCAR